MSVPIINFIFFGFSQIWNFHLLLSKIDNIGWSNSLISILWITEIEKHYLKIIDMIYTKLIQTKKGIIIQGIVLFLLSIKRFSTISTSFSSFQNFANQDWLKKDNLRNLKNLSMKQNVEDKMLLQNTAFSGALLITMIYVLIKSQMITIRYSCSLNINTMKWLYKIENTNLKKPM